MLWEGLRVQKTKPPSALHRSEFFCCLLFVITREQEPVREDHYRGGRNGLLSDDEKRAKENEFYSSKLYLQINTTRGWQTIS